MVRIAYRIGPLQLYGVQPIGDAAAVAEAVSDDTLVRCITKNELQTWMAALTTDMTLLCRITAGPEEADGRRANGRGRGPKEIEPYVHAAA